MDVIVVIVELAVLAAALYYGARIARALIREPNLRFYLKHTLKDLKNMYYRYHV